MDHRDGHAELAHGQGVRRELYAAVSESQPSRERKEEAMTWLINLFRRLFGIEERPPLVSVPPPSGEKAVGKAVNIRFKSEVVKDRFFGVNATLRGVCVEMAEYCSRRGEAFTLTEALTTPEEDKALGRVSLSHQEGRAVDIRTTNWPTSFRELFMAEFSSRFGSLGAITKDGKRKLLVYHDSGHGAHIHCQLDSKYKVKS
jgi:hypothetical protein